MKFIIFIILTCWSFINIHAQEVDHLEFMGIPINGKYSSFKKELKKKGFSQNYSLGPYTFKGLFAGHKAIVNVFYDKESKNVYRVGVIIPSYTADIAQSRYNLLSDKISKKYEADKIRLYQMIYNDNGIQLEEDIKSGKLTRLNMPIFDAKADGNRESSGVYVTKPLIKRFFEDDTLHFSSVLMNCLGNVGKIVITTSESSYNPNHPEFDNCVLIFYQDAQNYDIINKKEEDDL